MADDRDITERLQRIGMQRALAQNVLRESAAELPALVRKAHEAGVPKTVISRLAGISRPTLDQWLKGR
jgi:hypothetical protein